MVILLLEAGISRCCAHIQVRLLQSIARGVFLRVGAGGRVLMRLRAGGTPRTYGVAWRDVT